MKTEMSIHSGNKVGGVWQVSRETEERQSRDVVKVYTTLFSHPNVEAIVWWKFTDLIGLNGSPAGLIGRDMSPKPAYDALKKLIKETLWTHVALQTNHNGEVSFRGFYGDYSVVVSGPSGKTHATSFSLRRGVERVEVVLDET